MIPKQQKAFLLPGILLLVLVSCGPKKDTTGATAISSLNLKRGTLVSCGPPGQEFGSVGFATSCSEKVKPDFDLAMALLHSFEYDEAEKVFANVIQQEPDCAMAYWGVAMSNYHPLWAPPAPPELQKGAKAVAIAQSLALKSGPEAAYIGAIAQFYNDWETTDHRTRSLRYEQAMEQVYNEYRNNKEAAILYALALTATADPADKTFARQKKAGALLTALHPDGPNHPGIAHYIIHAYDFPELAAQALPAARKYAAIAPSSAHAQHMPSHIFTRLGLWDECINSNLVAASSAKCYAQEAGLKGHWDEELHALDYLVYGYLQRGDNTSAKKQWDYLAGIHDVSPVNFKVLYAFAAIPARYVMENRLWQEAAALKFHPVNFPWDDYPWQKAIVHFARLLGATHTGQLDAAHGELKKLNAIYDTLLAQKDLYKAAQVHVQIKTGDAWIRLKEGKKGEALQLMQAATDAEDRTEKHAVTPGEVLPARELLGDMLLQLNKYAEALQAYEANLKQRPNRFNSLYGAAVASERTKNIKKATFYYHQLLAVTKGVQSDRPEVQAAQAFLHKAQAVVAK